MNDKVSQTTKQKRVKSGIDMNPLRLSAATQISCPCHRLLTLPVVIPTLPPLAVVSPVTVPAVTLTLPPLPKSPVPTAIVTLPPAPHVAPPVLSVMRPEAPEDAVPGVVWCEVRWRVKKNKRKRKGKKKKQ